MKDSKEQNKSMLKKWSQQLQENLSAAIHLHSMCEILIKRITNKIERREKSNKKKKNKESEKPYLLMVR